MGSAKTCSETRQPALPPPEAKLTSTAMPSFSNLWPWHSPVPIFARINIDVLLDKPMPDELAGKVIEFFKQHL